MSADRNVLVHLAAGIGNIVLGTPLLIALREAGFTVDLLLHADYPETAELFRNWSVINEVILPSSPKALRSDYDVTVPAVPPFYWTRLRHWHTNRRSLPRPPDSLFYSDEQEYYFTFARALGFRGPRPSATLPITPSVERIQVVLAPGCKTGEMAAKRWPYFPQLAQCFQDVAVVGTADDLKSFTGDALSFPAHARLCTDLSLVETASLLAGADLVIGNDSGLSHVAAALGTRTFILFGPTSHQALGLLPPNVLVIRSGLPCEPCWTKNRLRPCAGEVTCLQNISVEKVAALAKAELFPQAVSGREAELAGLLG